MTKTYNHAANMKKVGFCPACDRNSGRCNRPVRTIEGSIGEGLTIRDFDQLRILDSMEGGLPDWFPLEDERKDRK